MNERGRGRGRGGGEAGRGRRREGEGEGVKEGGDEINNHLSHLSIYNYNQR